jgi:hypothetical protein
MYQAGMNKGELKKMPSTDIRLPIHPVHGIVNRGDYPVEELFIHKPDFFWQIGTTTIIQNLDGPHHKKKIHYLRDERINSFLVDKGYIVKRHPFERMTLTMLRGIYEETRLLVNRTIEEWDKLSKREARGFVDRIEKVVRGYR